MKTVCCGKSLQEGLKIFAILDLIFDNIQVAFLFLCLAYPPWVTEEQDGIHPVRKLFPNNTITIVASNSSSVSQAIVDEGPAPPYHESDALLVSSAFGSVICLLISILLFYWLWTGAKERDLTKCNKWLCVRLVFLCLSIIATIFKAVEGNYYTFDGSFEIWKIYSIYELFVVKSFINELKGGGSILMKEMA